MKNSIKKSVVGVILLSVSMAVGFEEKKTHLISQEPASDVALTVAIPEPAPGAFQVTLPVVPLEQTAPKLEQIISCFTTVGVREKSIAFFQRQTPEAREALNSAAKKALKPSGSDADQQKTTRAFTQSVVNCVQQGLQEQHEKTRAAIEQEHQERVEQIRSDARSKSKRIMKITGATFCSGFFVGGLVTLLNATGACHQR